MKADKTHVLLPGSRRPKDPNTVHVRDVNPDEMIDVTIALAGPKLPGPDEYAGQTITEAELSEKFGAKKEDADKVAKVLKKFGFKVESVSLPTQTMRLIGSAKAIQAAFQPDMAIVRSARQPGEYRGRSGTLKIPTELKGIVKGVFGIDERRMARRKRAPAHNSPATGVAPQSPADLEQRYGFPPGDAAGQNIAIAEFGGGYFDEDTKAYCAKFNRPAPDVQPVAVDAPAYTLQQVMALPVGQRKGVLGDATEVMLDVQVIAGLCPAANISVYFSTFDEQGWVDLVTAVIKAKPVVLSCSWGLAEEDPGWSASAIASIQKVLNAARLLGITVCVASGDDGSSDAIEDGKAHVDFPGSSPFVLSVGGTMLKKSGASVSEVTWWESPGRRIQNNGGGATGGGVSMKFDRPAWQNVTIASLNPNSIDGRVVPDVAALAGQPLYDLIFLGKDAPNGGTSASAPLWAALIARINAMLPLDKQQRFLTPLLYMNLPSGKPVGKASSRDITSGNNTTFPKPGKGYTAGAGFDAVTGWGVPDGGALLNSLQAV
ncbi:MAG: S53 family peptidase [Acidobacteriaceae bacterium]